MTPAPDAQFAALATAAQAARLKAKAIAGEAMQGLASGNVAAMFAKAAEACEVVVASCRTSAAACRAAHGQPADVRRDTAAGAMHTAKGARMFLPLASLGGSTTRAATVSEAATEAEQAARELDVAAAQNAAATAEAAAQMITSAFGAHFGAGQGEGGGGR